MEVLADNYEFNENVGPCLGFRRAASVLKSLPAPLCSVNTVGLPCLGPETMAVIQVREYRSL